MTGIELDPMSSSKFSHIRSSNSLDKSHASSESSLLFNVRREGEQTKSQAAPGSYQVKILFPPVSASNSKLDNCVEDDCDWLLVDLFTLPPDALEKVLRPNQISGTEVRGFAAGDVEDQGFVTISVLGGLRTGVLTNISSTLNINGSRYEAMLITMDKLLPLGTSGIWVKKGDCVAGYIIAVRQDLPWAYMIPMGDAITDMKKTLRTNDVRIPEAAEVEVLRERFISKAMTNYDQEDSNLTGLSPMNSKSTMALDVEDSTAELRSDPHTTRDSLVLLGGLSPSQYIPSRLGSHLVSNYLHEVSVPQSPASKLRQALEWRMERNWEHQKFISHREIDILITKEVVSELLREDVSLRETMPYLSDNMRGTLIKHIKTFTPRLLCLCIYVDLPLACLCELLDYGVDDSNLPLSIEQCPAVRWRTQWDLMIQAQGIFLALEFPSDLLFQDCEVSENIVLPFLSETPKKLIGEGSFGRVYKVKIHPDYDVFSAKETTPRHYALKVFQGGAQHEAAYRNEVSCLQQLSKTFHEHIMTSHASWRQGDRYFLLMTAADGNLSEFLSTKESPNLSYRNIEWLLLQIRGLADALSVIHNALSTIYGAATESEPRYTGFHHDIKPANILVFSKDAEQLTLKISDFGMARFGPCLNTEGLESESYFTRRSPDINAAYGAPETYQSGQLSRSYDIWSLGCVFTDVLVWFLGGANSDPKTFTLQRSQEILHAKGKTNGSFWYIDARGDAHVKPIVVKRLLELRLRCSRLSALAGLVDIICSMLTVDPTSRPNAFILRTELDKLVLQADDGALRPSYGYLCHCLTREGEDWDQVSRAKIYKFLGEIEEKMRTSKRASLRGQVRRMYQLRRQIETLVWNVHDREAGKVFWEAFDMNYHRKSNAVKVTSNMDFVKIVAYSYGRPTTDGELLSLMRSIATFPCSIQHRFMVYFSLTTDLVLVLKPRQGTSSLTRDGGRISLRNLVPSDHAFLAASSNGDLPTMRKFLASKEASPFMVTDGGVTPLCLSIQNGHAEAVDLLLTEGAYVNEPFGRKMATALSWALKHRREDICRMLLRRGANYHDQNVYGWSPIFYLWSQGERIEDSRLTVLIEMLRARDDEFPWLHQNIVDTAGWGLMHRVAVFGTPADVKMLIRAGVDVFQPSGHNNWQAPHFAVQFGVHDNFLILLAEYERRYGLTKAIEMSDSTGWTMLQIAIAGGHEEVVKGGRDEILRTLLGLGADREAQTWPVSDESSDESSDEWYDAEEELWQDLDPIPGSGKLTD
ncbi:CAMK/PKD protein kinase [Cladophialophora psammophila CBS 110553]|uniref:CAMK/PKD protein kinase n=1 Tax=Cladophialophora psammophila CBS 110553 TaxID=1182543 RepID=W9XFQ9_9EURO|nr:CAMK/PKD protein kinase [Cladophialophora psammophila CBS 110553]EXJ69219.1 CAMK/PKD protein kinase [Cladophialophora psammophila CBS 110553]